MRGVTWRAVPAKVKTGICEMKILGSEVLWSIFVTLVQDGLATNAWCNMEICSGKGQKRDVWDEDLTVWGFVVHPWEVVSRWVGKNAWCNMESRSGKIQKRDVGSCYLIVLWCFMPIWHLWCQQVFDTMWERKLGWKMLEEKAVIEHSPVSARIWGFNLLNPMLSTDVFISCAIVFWFSTCPRDTGFRFKLLYLDLSFSEIGVRSAVHLVPYCYLLHLGSAGFYSRFWAESLELHPKLNAQRGCLEYPKSLGFFLNLFGTSFFWDSKGIWSFLTYPKPQGFLFLVEHMLLGYL